MTLCSTSDADKATLKGATRRLIKLVGGLESAAAACRTSSTSLGRFQNVNDEQFIPADVIADLEADIGDPIVTTELARLAGFTLTATAASADAPIDPARLAARIVRELGDFAATVESMDADGKRTPRELAACCVALDDVINAARRGRDSLQRQIVAEMQGRPA